MSKEESNRNILDSREKNKVFIEYALDNNWLIKPLNQSRFMPLTNPKTGITYPDLPCGDVTQEKPQGIVENKDYADWVGSTTGGGVTKSITVKDFEPNCVFCGSKMTKEVQEDTLIQYCPTCEETFTKKDVEFIEKWVENKGQYRLHEQVIKKYSTGLPSAVCRHGSRWVFQKKSGVSDALILLANRKTVSLQSNYKFTFIDAKDELEAIELIQTYFRKCQLLPRSWPIYNLFKQMHDYPVAMLCGLYGFTPELIKKAFCGYPLVFIVCDARDLPEKDYIKKYKSNRFPGIGDVRAKRMFDVFHTVIK